MLPQVKARYKKQTTVAFSDVTTLSPDLLQQTPNQSNHQTQQSSNEADRTEEEKPSKTQFQQQESP